MAGGGRGGTRGGDSMEGGGYGNESVRQILPPLAAASLPPFFRFACAKSLAEQTGKEDFNLLSPLKSSNLPTPCWIQHACFWCSYTSEDRFGLLECLTFGEMRT